MQYILHELEYTSRSDATHFLVGMGDIHRGNSHMDEALFYRHLDWIEETPNVRVILMGDYGDAINAKDPRHDYNTLDWQYVTPDKQYRKVTEDLMRIKDKIICALDGNHDYNYWKRHNYNFTEKLAYDLGVPYVGISAYIRLKFHRKSGKRGAKQYFNIYAHHGWSGGRTAAYKVRVIHDLSNVFPMLHCYLMGHTHQIGEAFPTVKLYTDRAGNIREFQERYFYTGSYIKGYEKGIGSYVEARAYHPTALGSQIIEIAPNRVDGGNKKNKPPFLVRGTSIDFEVKANG